ncbi:phBC6A51 family helix-turn-helix protein [Paenibacillus sp. CAU 1782]
MAKPLTAGQTIAIEWLSLPAKGGKTYEQIAELAGVTARTVENWRKDDSFDRELKRAIVRNNSGRLPEVITSLTDAVINEHNAAAAKLLLQVNGMLTDKVEVETKSDVGTDVEALRARLEAMKRSGNEGTSE